MAQKTIVTLWCDMPHLKKKTGEPEDVEAAETLTFAAEGTGYEIDVCPEHAKELRETITHYGEHARRITATRGGRGPRRVRSKGTSDIRAWAKRHGHKVSERGRIPADVIAAYEAAH